MDTAPDPAAIDASLNEARRLVSAGEGERAIALAVGVLDSALEAGDFARQGDAMHCMAVAELRILGRFDRALDLSERAALCQQRVHNDGGESAALAVHAVAAIRLGRHERAMESALLAVRLAEIAGESPRLVMAYQALGVAAYSGRNFDESRNAYQRAIRHATEAVPPLNAFELHVDLAATEAFLYFTERGLSGRRLSLDGLTRHVQEAERLIADAGNISLSPGSHANNLLVHAFTATLLAIWSGQTSSALSRRAKFATLALNSERPWLAALLLWVDAEIALADARLADARARAHEFIEIGLMHSHEMLTSNGYNLLSHICRKQGDLAAALDALLALTRREQAARAEGLKSRVAVIEWQMDLRRQERRMERLESDSRLFEKLAMEDALTGLANRRALEGRMQEWLPLAAGAPPLCVALVDVDRFKQVNDQHSHQVGDEVLKAVAAIFRHNLRDGDLAARLAGDEFVIAMPSTTLAQAEEVRTRLHAAVARHPWAALSAGLQVSLSIGLAQALPGESFEAVLAKSDAAMYSNKRAAAGVAA